MKHPPKNVSVQCFDWQKLILQHTDMPANAKYLALYLSSYMNINRDVAWPSLKTIERETGLTHPTVLKWLDFLVSEAWLIKESGSRTESNRYWINVPNEVGKSLTYVNDLHKVGKPLTSNNNTITKSIYKGFKKPSIEEVTTYCQERANNVDPERFINHYQSNGWKVGKNSMKDWKAAVRTWEKSNGNAKQNAGKSGDTRRLSPHERVRAKTEQRNRGVSEQAGTAMGGNGGMLE